MFNKHTRIVFYLHTSINSKRNIQFNMHTVDMSSYNRIAFPQALCAIKTKPYRVIVGSCAVSNNISDHSNFSHFSFSKLQHA